MTGKPTKKTTAKLKLILTDERKSWLRVRAATLDTTMSAEIERAIDLYRAHVERTGSVTAMGQTPA